MKKIFVTLMLLLPALGFVGCSNDDEPNASGGGSSSGSVSIDGKKFNIKYAYVVNWEDGDGVEITCSDTDLSDAYKGKPFKKTVSFIGIFYDDYDGFDMGGGYKVYLDAQGDLTYTKEKDSVCFEWYSDVSQYNPSGSSIDYNLSQMPFTVEGHGLKAETFRLGSDDNEEELGLKDFSISLKTTPKDITDYVYDLETRGVEVITISDPVQKSLFHKYFGRKK